MGKAGQILTGGLLAPAVAKKVRGVLKGPELPDAPPTPEPAKLEEQTQAREVTAAERARAEKGKKGRGRASTILTSPLGIPEPNVAVKTLLGG